MPCVFKHGRTGLPKCRSIYVPSCLRFIPITIRGSVLPRRESLWAVNLSHSFHGHLQITLLTHDDPSQHMYTNRSIQCKNVKEYSARISCIATYSTYENSRTQPGTYSKGGSRKNIISQQGGSPHKTKMNRALPHSTPTQTLESAACVLEYSVHVQYMIESIAIKGKMEPRMSIASGHGLAVDQELPSPADS